MYYCANVDNKTIMFSEHRCDTYDFDTIVVKDYYVFESKWIVNVIKEKFDIDLDSFMYNNFNKYWAFNESKFFGEIFVETVFCTDLSFTKDKVESVMGGGKFNGLIKKDETWFLKTQIPMVVEYLNDYKASREKGILRWFCVFGNKQLDSMINRLNEIYEGL